ncbi:MAG TPA: hypothetical protein VGF26_28315 [Ramlibacter sp.]
MFVAALLPVAAAAAGPGSLPGGSGLGMTVPELQRVEPALKRVPHPARLAGGLVGSWSGTAIDLAGLTVSPTYFFAEGQLQRIEFLARDRGPVAYAALLAWARAAWGAELAAADPGSAYASWSMEGFDAYLQLASPAPAGQVRLVVKQRVVKDASEL